MIRTKGNNQTQAGKLAVPISQKETGNPMANAAARACEMPLCHPSAAAMTPSMVANNMATEECTPWLVKKRNKYQAAPQTAKAVKGQRIRFDN